MSESVLIALYCFSHDARMWEFPFYRSCEKACGYYVIIYLCAMCTYLVSRLIIGIKGIQYAFISDCSQGLIVEQ